MCLIKTNFKSKWLWFIIHNDERVQKHLQMKNPFCGRKNEASFHFIVNEPWIWRKCDFKELNLIINITKNQLQRNHVSEEWIINVIFLCWSTFLILILIFVFVCVCTINCLNFNGFISSLHFFIPKFNNSVCKHRNMP